MATKKSKPKGFGKFANLMRKIVKVPKSEVDAMVEATKRKRRK